MYWTEDGSELVPLFMCLGMLGDRAEPSTNASGSVDRSYMTDPTNEYAITIYEVSGIPDPGSETETDEDDWGSETRSDPYSRERLEQEKQAAFGDPNYPATFY